MPTGYTSDIAKDISFPQFVMQCSRAFGALLDLRDSSSDTPIPEKLVVADFYAKSAEETKQEVIAWHSLSYLQKVELVSKNAAEELNRLTETIDGNRDLETKYRKMLNQVYNWKHPSEDHKGLKDFMIKQIQESIDFDCNNSYYVEKINEIGSMSDYDRVKNHEDSLHRRNAIAIESLDKETKRVSRNNTWIEVLRESLK